MRTWECLRSRSRLGLENICSFFPFHEGMEEERGLIPQRCSSSGSESPRKSPEKELGGGANGDGPGLTASEPGIADRPKADCSGNILRVDIGSDGCTMRCTRGFELKSRPQTMVFKLGMDERESCPK